MEVWPAQIKGRAVMHKTFFITVNTVSNNVHPYLYSESNVQNLHHIYVMLFKQSSHYAMYSWGETLNEPKFIFLAPLSPYFTSCMMALLAAE